MACERKKAHGKKRQELMPCLANFVKLPCIREEGLTFNVPHLCHHALVPLLNMPHLGNTAVVPCIVSAGFVRLARPAPLFGCFFASGLVFFSRYTYVNKRLAAATVAGNDGRTGSKRLTTV